MFIVWGCILFLTGINFLRSQYFSRLLGLCNNFGYVVMLSAAHDILAVNGTDQVLRNNLLMVLWPLLGRLVKDTLPWQQNFRISTILLDSDGYLHCRTMEEKYGLLFCSQVQSCIRKSYCTCQFFCFCCHICRTMDCWDPEILLPWQHDVTISPFYRVCMHFESPLKLQLVLD